MDWVCLQNESCFSTLLSRFRSPGSIYICAHLFHHDYSTSNFFPCQSPHQKNSRAFHLLGVNVAIAVFRPISFPVIPNPYWEDPKKSRPLRRKLLVFFSSSPPRYSSTSNVVYAHRIWYQSPKKQIPLPGIDKIRSIVYNRIKPFGEGSFLSSFAQTFNLPKNNPR